MSLANDLAEREMNALRAANRLTDAEIEQRWAWMAIALRGGPNLPDYSGHLPDVLDRVCKQALEANALRAALAEALDGWLGDNRPGCYDGDDARIAWLRAKFLGR